MTFDDSEDEITSPSLSLDEFDDLDGNQEDEFDFGEDEEEDDFDEDEEESNSSFDEYDDDSNLYYDDVFKEEEDYDEPYDDHEAEDGYGEPKSSRKGSYLDDYE